MSLRNITYTPLSALGQSAEFLEYDYTDNNMESVLSKEAAESPESLSYESFTTGELEAQLEKILGENTEFIGNLSEAEKGLLGIKGDSNTVNLRRMDNRQGFFELLGKFNLNEEIIKQAKPIIDKFC